MQGLRILLSGCWAEQYAGNQTHRLLSALSAKPVPGTLIAHLPPARYQASLPAGTQILPWVEDYRALLAEIDVQVFPIAIGSGTKGKVLEALAAGVVAIGSIEAFRNISPHPAEPHQTYSSPSEVPALLTGIATNFDQHRTAARAFAQQVRAHHATAPLVAEFWRALDR